MCEALEACANEAPITRVWIGSAGIDADESARIATEALRCAMPHVHEWTVTNDAALLCATVPHDRPCVVGIAGTGSVVLAYDAQRTRTKRVGGLGWLLGDEGSAVGVGRAALRHVLSERRDACATVVRIHVAEQVVGRSDPRSGEDPIQQGRWLAQHVSKSRASDSDRTALVTQ